MGCIPSRLASSCATVAVLVTWACARQHDSRVAEVVDGGDCEAAAREVGEGQSAAATVIDGVRQAGGTTASYGLAAAGYTADVVITGTVGIVAVTVFCPVFIAEIAACAASKGQCPHVGNF